MESSTQDASTGVAPVADGDEYASGTQDRLDTREALRAATASGLGDRNVTLGQRAQSLAVDWFLSNEPIPAEKTLDVDVGTRTIPWTITAIDAEAFKNARKLSEEGSRVQRRARQQAGGVVDVNQAENNARIVVAGTLDPDLRALAKQMQDAAGFVDNRQDKDAAAVELLRDRFTNKPGIIDMLAGEIVTISGYDDEAVVEHAAGKA